MSGFWGPNYPRRQQRQQYQLPAPGMDYDYYPMEGDSIIKRASFFMSGSCLTLLIFSVCLCSLAGVWFISTQVNMTVSIGGNNDAAANTAQTPVAGPVVQQPIGPPQPQFQAPPPAPTPTPTPTPPQTVAIGESILANDIGLSLIVFDIQRNVQPINVEAGQSEEFVAVSVGLENVNNNPSAYQIDDFQVQDPLGVAYFPDRQADNGRRLESGTIPGQSDLEGDLLFRVPPGQNPLTLLWRPAGTSVVYSVILQ